jgi:hypothetical protein
LKELLSIWTAWSSYTKPHWRRTHSKS